MTCHEPAMRWHRHPYLAPLAEPLKVIGNAAKFPIQSVFDVVEDATNPKSLRRDMSPGQRFLIAWGDREDDSFLLHASQGTMVLGAIGSAIAAIMAMGPTMPLAPLAFGTVAAATAGFIAAPLALFGTLALAGAMVGSLAAPYGIAKGLVAAARHFSRKPESVVPQAMNVAPPQVEPAASAIMKRKPRSAFALSVHRRKAHDVRTPGYKARAFVSP